MSSFILCIQEVWSKMLLYDCSDHQLKSDQSLAGRVMESKEKHDRALHQTLQKISKPSYKAIRQQLREHSTQFSYLQDDNDLKKMSSDQALELIHWFNQEAFGISRNLLLPVQSEDLYASMQLPVPPNANECLAKLNANLLAYEGFAKINQHLPYSIDMLWGPERYATQWKQLLWQMLDFLAFKQEMLPRHQAESEKALAAEANLAELTGQVRAQTDRILELQQTKEAQAAEVAAKREQIGALQSEKSQMEERLAKLDKVKRDKQSLLEAAKQEWTLRLTKVEEKKRCMAELESQRVLEDPLEADAAMKAVQERLLVKSTTLEAKRSELQASKQRNTTLTKQLEAMKSHLVMIKSAKQMQEQVACGREQVEKAKRQISALHDQNQLIQSDISSMQNVFTSQEKQDATFQQFARDQVTDLTRQRSLLQASIEETKQHAVTADAQAVAREERLKELVSKAKGEMEANKKAENSCLLLSMKITQATDLMNEQIQQRVSAMSIPCSDWTAKPNQEFR